MQYKIILSAFLLTAGLSPAYAQQQKKTAVPKTAATAAKSDTAGRKSLISKIPLLANNMPAPAVKSADKKSHVPLAGEKSYFGDKNEYVNDFVRKYMELHNRTLSSVQSNSATPFSVIDNVLEKKNLPKELKYLAVIESALNHNAVSHAGAVGPWQLMQSTAKMMGLTVNRHNDERTDWYKSTTAATKYLELLYNQLDDWLLVIAAYNSGPAVVQRAIDRTGSRNFWDIKEYLPRETQGHVLAFIATASIFENLSKFIDLGSIPVDFKFGKEDDLLAPKLANDPILAAAAANAAKTGAPATAGKKTTYTDEELKNMSMVRITEPVYLDLMADEIGVDKKILSRWNPDYDQYMFKPASYPTPFYNLRLPKDKVAMFVQKKDQITKKSKAILSQIK